MRRPLSSTAFAKEPQAMDVITRVWNYMRGKTSVCQVKMTVRAPYELGTGIGYKSLDKGKK